MAKNVTRKKKNHMGGSTCKTNPMGGGAKTPAVGTKAQVWHGKAKHTSGGLTRKDLMKTKKGRIVSRKKHLSAKRDNRLVKAGYKTKKGHLALLRLVLKVEDTVKVRR